jgi:hypothetical protein
VGQSRKSASARRMGLAESTVRGIDLRYLERCEASRRKPPLRHRGVDELYQGKKDKFLTVVCNLETAEPLWFGRERKKETLDDFFSGPVEQSAAPRDRGGVRGHVGAVSPEYRAIGAGLQGHLRQVPCIGACQ